MTMSPTKIERALIAGGTHGNEYTGAFLVKRWLADPSELSRPSFSSEVLLANPEAMAAARRYVDRDLNRCFDRATLEGEDRSYEARRAREIAKKVRELDPERQVLFDLHTTTSNMECSLILTEHNPFNRAMMAWLTAGDPRVRCYEWAEPDKESQFFNGLSPNGFAIEVGPIANAVLRAETIALTREVLLKSLDCVERWNAGERPTGSFVAYRFVTHVDYPRDKAGLPAAMIHPELQDRDYALLSPGDPLFLSLDGRTIPYEGERALHPVFINEAAYYEKGIALSLTEKVELPAS